MILFNRISLWTSTAAPPQIILINKKYFGTCALKIINYIVCGSTKQMKQIMWHVLVEGQKALEISTISILSTNVVQLVSTSLVDLD